MYQIPNTDLIIYCAAIRLHDGNGWVEMYGKRHHYIAKDIAAAGLEFYYKQWHEDGFLVGHSHYTRGSTKGWPQFLTRAQATNLAQIYNIPIAGDMLVTKDLW